MKILADGTLYLTKAEALAAFGGKQVALARALGVTKAAVSLWPKRLSPMLSDRVITLTWRLGRPLVDRRRKAA